VLADGRRCRTRTRLDTVTCECLAMEVDPSVPGQRVVRVLEQRVARSGAPKQIPLDHGPACTGQALDAWAYAQHVTRDFIEPGNPAQHGHLERFTGKFRDECLNVPWFLRLTHARQGIDAWREEDTTPPSDPTVPCASSLQHSCSGNSNLALFLIIPGRTQGSRSARASWTC